MKYGIYGTMILTKSEKRTIRDYLLSFPCPVCNSRRGKPCKGTLYVHMGRVPKGYDALIVLNKTRVAQHKKKYPL